MLNLVLFGPPGAGKGTQSQFLIRDMGLLHLSTGDLLRSEIAIGSALGLRAQSLMDAGLLVPDEVVIGMIQNKLQGNPDAFGFIFDGFPRTIAQAEALDTLLNGLQTSIHCMISMAVPREELIQRLLLRGQNSGRTDDQDRNIIEQRIEEYLRKTAPVADYYRQRNKLKEIDGLGSLEDIYARIQAAVSGMDLGQSQGASNLQN
jgi:adenylate kinase